ARSSRLPPDPPRPGATHASPPSAGASARVPAAAGRPVESPIMARKKSQDDIRADGAAAVKPKKRRWYRQLWDVYTMTRTAQPSITWWLLGVFFGVVAIAVV